MTDFNITDEEIVEYADKLIIHSSPVGFVYSDALILYDNIWDVNYPKELKELNNLLRKRLQENGGFEVVGEFGQSLFDRIKDHLKYNDYLLPFDNTLTWRLNDNGKLCKRLKGHYEYIDYLNKKIDAEIAEMNGKIDWLQRVIIAAIVAFFFGIISVVITEKLKCKKENKAEVSKKELEQVLSILENEKIYHDKCVIDSYKIQQKLNAKYDLTKQTKAKHSTNSQQ